MKTIFGLARALTTVGLVLVLLLWPALPALAQPTGAATGQAEVKGVHTFTGPSVGAGIGAGLVIIGAGFGFSKIGAAALEGMARQPEVAGRIQTAMLIIAALLEGATFFALIVCIVVAGRGGTGL